MAKNILVKFDLQIGEQSFSDQYIFHNKTTDYKYCKQFWGLKKKDELDKGVYWDNQGLNAISVYSSQEITNEEVKTLQKLGVVYGLER